MGFGTGKHPTTKMCAEFIVENSTRAKSMIDVGSGSGILSILTKKLGLELVECIEIDEQARENAEENLQLNNIKLQTYTNIDDVKKSYDLVVANIITPTLIALKTLLEKLTQKYLILSGILNIEEKIILENFSDNFQLVQKKTMDEWCAFLFKKKTCTEKD
jgi:ribosomal protein L11 methyltransferase